MDLVHFIMRGQAVPRMHKRVLHTSSVYCYMVLFETDDGADVELGQCEGG